MAWNDQQQPAAPRWLFEVVVFGTVGLLLFFMMAGMEIGLYGAGIVGLCASILLGRVSVQRQWVSVPEGIKRLGTLWLYVFGFAALSVVNGKWEPAAFFGVVGLTMTGCYAIGARSGMSRPV